MAHRQLTGVLLVGGASRRYGTPKALVRVAGETLAERGQRMLAAACEEVLVVGKPGELELPFPVLDDESDVRVPLAGVLAGLRAARNDVCVVLPVDCPLVTPELVRLLGAACRDAAVPAGGPLPGAWAASSLPVLERRFAAGDYGLRDAYGELDVAFPPFDQRLAADADTPAELAALLGL